jgi:hypothetical protein
MNLDKKAEPKKCSICLTFENSTRTELKLHSYVSSAPPLSKLPDTLSHSNKTAPNNHDFELPQDLNHGIWIRYRYVDDEARGFDVCIHARFSKSQGIDMNTDVYYINGQKEERILSREAIYTMYDVEGTTRCQVSDRTSSGNVEKENDLTFSAYVQYDTADVEDYDLRASIKIRLLEESTP